MSKVKFKEMTEFKTYGKSVPVDKCLGNQEINSTTQKFNYKDCVNEMFAGLIWLG